MSTTSTPTLGDDHRVHETILLSTKLIVESQEAMLRRMEACNEASTASIASLLCKVVESQAQNQQQQAHNQQQIMEMLKILGNNINSINNAGIYNEEAAGISRIVIADEQNRHSAAIADDYIEEVDKESSEIDEQQEVVNQVYQEDGEPSYYDESLFQKLISMGWKKAKEYLNDNHTAIEKMFKTRDSSKQIHGILKRAVYYHQYTFLVEFLKLVPRKALEYKNSRLTQIRTTDDPQIVPLVLAAISVTDGQKEVVEYLCTVTRDKHPSPFSGKEGVALLFHLMSANMYGTALSVCQRYPKLVKYIMDVGDGDSGMTHILQFILERPFAFLSGSKLKWWERCIYTIIEVDMDSPHKGGIQQEKQKVNLESTTKNDEENPPDAPKVSSSREQCSSTINKTPISMKRMSAYFERQIRRVPLIRRLYDQKLMHKDVIALTKFFLSQIDKGMDKKRVKAIFLNSKMLENAMKVGTTEFMLECLKAFPFLCLDDKEGDVGHTLIKLVVSERNEMIYNFRRILKKGYLGDARSHLDKNNNSILHYCAELPHNRRLNAISGAAFQMQQEIQWFKGIEITMLQKDRFVRNKDGDTAQFLFTEKHKGLMKEGERWMKDLSTSCMVVATLIATVAFAAAITVPGGNIQDNNSRDNGLPVFLKRNSFMVFETAYALALCSSVTSVLMFLAVFTSRYSEEAFLKALPQRLIIGLSTLFVSMASILVSFVAAFTIILGQRFHWAPIAVSLISCAPVLLFGFLQFPLFVEMVSSTYWPTILRKQDHRIFEPYFPKTDWAMFLIRKQGKR
ncbi:hypothetical protein MKX03_001707 [Papaver bracteatum]|nr:hypothetical protein MKX03_001707 [Papaver bracteatum]